MIRKNIFGMKDETVSIVPNRQSGIFINIIVNKNY